MKRILIALALGSIALTASPESLQQKRVARGQYLVTISGCSDCHSPKKAGFAPDTDRLLSGRPATTPAPSQPANPGQVSAAGDLTAWYGPWGISYSANLTPDPETGIGRRYNEKSFIKTLRTGKKPEGEELLPPMPWPNFAQMTDEDLKSIYAYLQTLKPVKNFVRTAAAPAPVKAAAR